MKEFKALEILKKYMKTIDDDGMSLDEYCDEWEPKLLEAIAELEALQAENEHLKNMLKAYKGK